jgi:hypothetical protein
MHAYAHLCTLVHVLLQSAVLQRCNCCKTKQKQQLSKNSLVYITLAHRAGCRSILDGEALALSALKL